jgi:hypothetical protein
MEKIIVENPEEWLKAQGCLKHHTALTAGYVSREGEYIAEYSGKYGKGYTRHISTNKAGLKTKRFHLIQYWIRSESDQ